MAEPMSQSEYLEASGFHCPACRCNQTEAAQFEAGDSSDVNCEVSCLKCGAIWTDVLKLSGYENLRLPDGTLAEPMEGAAAPA